MDRQKAIKYMHDLLRLMKAKEGSDLYIAAGAVPSIKVHGRLEQVSSQKMSPQHTQMLTRSIMNDKQSAEFEAPTNVILPSVCPAYRAFGLVLIPSVAVLLWWCAQLPPRFRNSKICCYLRYCKK